MTTDNKAELLPCPFCGGEANLVECPDSIDDIPHEDGRYVIECNFCALSLPAFYTTKPHAIKHWNTRQSLTAPKIIAGILCMIEWMANDEAGYDADELRGMAKKILRTIRKMDSKNDH